MNMRNYRIFAINTNKNQTLWMGWMDISFELLGHLVTMVKQFLFMVSRNEGYLAFFKVR